MEFPVSISRSPAGCLTRMLPAVMAKEYPVKVLPVSTEQAARPFSGETVGATRACGGAAGSAARREDKKEAPPPERIARSTSRIAARRSHTRIRDTLIDLRRFDDLH